MEQKRQKTHRDGNGQTIYISEGNTKMGKISSFSLMPGQTCSAAACQTCYKEGCYARKTAEFRTACGATWQRNTDLCKTNLKLVESQLDGYLMWRNPKYFRVHVSGDFFSEEYAKMWARVARRYPETRFLAFTKQFGNVAGVRFPKNFHIVLSEWDGITVPEELQRKFPKARVIIRRDKVPEGYTLCSGHCDTCSACYETRENVVFYKH